MGPSGSGHSHGRVVWITVGVLVGVAAGCAGLCAYLWLLVLATRAPLARKARAWRLLALTSLTTGLVGGLIGSLVGLVRGLGYPQTAYFAFLEGGVLVGLPMLVAGALVGAVLAFDHLRQYPARPQNASGGT